MPGIKKIRRIGWLMVASELLLALFIGRWLYSEFNSEKMDLHKKLFDQFVAAKSRVMDSVISKNFIAPMLNDPEGFKIRTIDNNEFHRDSIRIITMNSDFDVRLKDSLLMSSVTIGDSTWHENETVHLRLKTDSADDVLFRGVRMFISKVRGSHGEEEYFEKHIEEGDTLLLKSYFTQNLQQNNLGVKTVWVNTSPGPGSLFYYDSKFFDHPYGVQIERINHYLLFQISPLIAFALLLIGITSAAFVFAYRNLRNQIRLNDMKDDFISNMSHELKTPVATVKVALEALGSMNEESKKDKMTDYLDMASQELSRLDLLVNKIMNGVLMENGKQDFHFEKVNLKLLAEQTLKSLQFQLQQRDGKVLLTCNDENIRVNGDELHLQGVLFNLVDNSLKYVSTDPVITINIYQTGPGVILEVTDNGPGISEDYQSKVFEKFFRVPSGNKHNVKGYGLGLSYVAQVMNHHSGTVTVQNLPEGGCRFTLKFPRTE